MSRTDTWMPLNIGEHMKETRRMSPLAHSAYVCLLMDYWCGGAIPDDDETLATTARMSAKEWRSIAGQVRAAFAHRDGKLHHERLDAERARAEQIASKRSAAAAARWSKADANAYASAYANEDAKPMQTASDADASDAILHEPGISHLQSQLHKQEGSLRSQRAREPDGFAEWWREYPRKDAKDAARRAYAKALKRTTPATLLIALRMYPFQSDPQFVPMPATWLNGGRWESAHEAEAVKKAEPEGKLAYLAQYRGML